MTWTVSAAAVEWDLSKRTIQKRLTAAGHTLTSGAKFTTAQISAAVHGGDLDAARVRESDQRTALLQRKRELIDGDVVSTATARKLLSDSLLYVRQRLDALPAE